MAADGLITIGSIKDVAYVTGDVFAADLEVKRDCALRISVWLDTAVKLELAYDGVIAKAGFNNNANLVANALSTFVWGVIAGEKFNFELSAAAQIKRLVVQATFGAVL